ncbi:MAG: hypothetical protein HOM78_07380, partial [Candidatus Marinimicrobia bacterium]|nr:hypothetical protein [Candidatus Neomarinimicrobiota bacterium]MBT4957597.1 hypothetical protein [Candidatus Neomarinimicrobiota bacterium]
MLTYFIRRLLLMIPTFLGSTILVFTILQLAPGGPLEQTIMQLQMGGMTGGAEGGGSSVSAMGGSVLPESAMKELKRFYGFDKPIYQRYLIWLGIWPREIKHRDFTIPSDQNQVEKRVGKRDGQIWRVDVSADENGNLSVFEKDGSASPVWYASIDETDDNGSRKAVIFQQEYSGILTGNLGKSYTYAKPVTEVMAPRFKVSLFFGLIGYFLSYIVCIPLGIKKALKHGSTFDFVSSVIIFVAYSIPGWALGGVLLVLFGGGTFWD